MNKQEVDVKTFIKISNVMIWCNTIFAFIYRYKKRSDCRGPADAKDSYTFIGIQHVI